MDKFKTITQVWEQSERIINYLQHKGRHESVGKVERMAAQYGCNMVDWMRIFMSIYELDSHYQHVQVPKNIYTRASSIPYKTYEISVKFDDGDSLTTKINARTKQEVLNHYHDKDFYYGWDDGERWQETKRKVTDVKFLNHMEDELCAI